MDERLIWTKASGYYRMNDNNGWKSLCGQTRMVFQVHDEINSIDVMDGGEMHSCKHDGRFLF